MTKLLKEPLLHFLVLGALLFCAYAWIDRGRTQEKPRLVRITAQEVAWLQEGYARQRQLPPTDDELRGLVAAYLKEELLAREARELGLDEGDTIVRRRLAQKMEFLVEDASRAVEPTDAELQTLYKTHPDRSLSPARMTFTQIFFKSEPAARKGLERLCSGDAAVLGDPIPLERETTGADEAAVARTFGTEFAGQLFALESGRWQGPLASSYGFHLVLVSAHDAARARPFDEVRAELLADWQGERQSKANQQFFADLMKKYEVVVDDDVKALLGPVTLPTDAAR